VPVSIAPSGGAMNLAFPTCLDLAYEVRWKTNLSDAAWLVLTNITGDGRNQVVTGGLQSASSFFRVARRCE
jgi:hypothetical protein